jgi:hypothetical protein
MKTILVQLFIAAAWIAMIAYGVSGNTPYWLQLAGWTIFAIYLVGGSVYLMLKPKNAGQRWGQAGLFPRSWYRRWFLDEREEKSLRKRVR